MSEELWDFCRDCLGSKISSETPANELYPLSNLTSNDIGLRKRGFLAEAFVRPPVEFDVTFEKPLNIRSIAFSPLVSAQQSSVFEIWVKPANQSHCGYQRVGRADAEGQKVTFISSRHRRALDNSSFGIKSVHFLSNQRVLQQAQAVKIRIVRTIGSNSPGLSDLCILATLADSKDYQGFSQTRLTQSGSNQTLVSFYGSGASGGEVQTLPTLATESRPKPSLPAAPDQPRLDAITHLPMTTPLVLPSGYLVDKTTLDHYNHEEDKWGRAPNDPFTKKPFTSKLKPIALTD